MAKHKKRSGSLKRLKAIQENLMADSAAAVAGMAGEQPDEAADYELSGGLGFARGRLLWGKALCLSCAGGCHRHQHCIWLRSEPPCVSGPCFLWRGQLSTKTAPLPPLLLCLLPAALFSTLDTSSALDHGARKALKRRLNPVVDLAAAAEDRLTADGYGLAHNAARSETVSRGLDLADLPWEGGTRVSGHPPCCVCVVGLRLRQTCLLCAGFASLVPACCSSAGAAPTCVSLMRDSFVKVAGGVYTASSRGA